MKFVRSMNPIGTAMFAVLVCGAAANSLATDAPNLSGRFLAALSDTEIVFSSYVTGRIGELDPKYGDSLSLFALTPDADTKPAAVLPLSNSNFGPSGAIVASPAGDRVYVAETVGRAEPGMERIGELVSSPRIFAVDVSDLSAPRLIDTVAVGERVQTLDLSPDGRTLVAVSLTEQRPLAFVPITESGFGAPVRFDIPDLPPRPDLHRQNGYTWVRWHPSRDLIAVHLTDRSQVAFYMVVRDASGQPLKLRPWGNVVQVNKFPFVGRFSPDGRHYVTSDVQWGPDVPFFYGARDGVLTLIRLGTEDSPAEAPRHQVVDVEATGRSAETLAFSPDGAFLVTSNIDYTARPDTFPGYDPQASLSLYRLDGETSDLVRIERYRYVGLLPQGLAFDASGAFLFVGINSYPGDTNELQSGIEIWRLKRQPEPRLEPTKTVLRAPRGLHALELVD